MYITILLKLNSVTPKFLNTLLCSKDQAEIPSVPIKYLGCSAKHLMWIPFSSILLQMLDSSAAICINYVRILTHRPIFNLVVAPNSKGGQIRWG